MSYVYIRTEPRLWTAGFYRPDGKFEPDSDHSSSDDAAERVAYLNGGGARISDLEKRLGDALTRIADLGMRLHDHEQLSPAGES